MFISLCRVDNWLKLLRTYLYIRMEPSLNFLDLVKKMFFLKK